MAQELVFDAGLQSRKDLAWWLYLFHAASLVFSLGAFSWIPLIISYLKRPDTAGTFVYSHHTWQIRSFWWYLVWVVIGGALCATIVLLPVGLAILGLAWLWKAYRLLKGFFALNDNRPMPM
jgi:uncharacterized membrane protein